MMAVNRRRGGRGVSLIEALVALAVMAFGLLGVVGLQANLRTNGDLSRQRAEAARIAQAAVEDWRAIASVQPGVAAAGFANYADDLVSDSAAADKPGINATYHTTRTVTLMPGASPPMKWLTVTVAWTDRAGAAQSVVLNTAIAGVTPELAGTLAIPPSTLFALSATASRRNPNIPTEAVDLGNGTSAYQPPQGESSSVVWVFNNLTGVLNSCSLKEHAHSLSLANIEGCSTVPAQLLQGYVNFADASALASATQALSPTGTAFAVEVRVKRTAPSALTVDESSGCFTSSRDSHKSFVSYYCAVPTDTGSTWSGYAIVTAATLPVVPVVGGLSTCRYTSLRQDSPAPPNAQHPRAYSAVSAPLSNQNFLVVRVVSTDASDCPTGSPLPSGTTTFPQPQTAP
jgi:Tfp pilus assembly protein PilV